MPIADALRQKRAILYNKKKIYLTAVSCENNLCAQVTGRLRELK